MQGLSLVVSLAAYVAFCAALLMGAQVWLEAQGARVDAAFNASSRLWSCAVVQDIGRSGAVVVFGGRVHACQGGWRPEVVQVAS